MPADATEPWTVLKLLDWTRQRFEKSYIESPRLAAEVLLAHAMTCQRVMLYARYDYQPTEQELAVFRELVKRACDYQPIAYLVGYKEFYSLRLKVSPDVLIPRADTEMLVAEAVAHLRSLGRAGVMWDVGTGCGCVAVATAANVPDVTVLATDISEAAVAVAAQNAADHGLADRVRCRQADMLNLPDDCADLGAFDVITANLPYVADNETISRTVRHEPGIAVHGGPEGMDFLRPLIAGAPQLLASGGKLILEFGFGQPDMVRDVIARTAGLAEPRILCDHQGIERTAVTTRTE